MTDQIGQRMKAYEYVTRTYLMRRMPVIIRVDGKAFHTFTRGFKRPFDEILVKSMQHTMKYLCENIQGCVLGYTQSDEISLLLVDYKKLNSAAWFDYNVQKCVSIAASMATMAFNKAFDAAFTEYYVSSFPRGSDSNVPYDADYIEKLHKAVVSGAMFDARIFNLSREEVCNYFYWRQLDAVRNSILMVGQSQFSHSVLHKKNCKDILGMLREQKGIDWNDLPTHLKRGSGCVRVVDTNHDGSVVRSRWEIDTDIPEFIGPGRDYVGRLLNYINTEIE